MDTNAVLVMMVVKMYKFTAIKYTNFINSFDGPGILFSVSSSKLKPDPPEFGHKSLERNPVNGPGLLGLVFPDLSIY